MFRNLPKVAGTALLAAALVLPTSAGAVDYLVTDVAEDSNGINSQGLDGITGGGTPNDTATPAGVRSYDLLGARYVTSFETVTDADGNDVNVATGLEARMAMTLDPTESPFPGIVRMVHEVNGCSMFFQYYGGTNGQNTAGDGNIRITCEGDLTGGNPANITEGDALDVYFDAGAMELVWDFEFDTGTAADTYIKDGATIVPGTSHTRANTGVVTAPVYDEMANTTGAFFRIGSDIPEA